MFPAAGKNTGALFQSTNSLRLAAFLQPYLSNTDDGSTVSYQKLCAVCFIGRKVNLEK